MATRSFPAVPRDITDALTPLLVKGTTPSEVAARLDVALASAAQYLDAACHDGLAEPRGAEHDRTWWITPTTTTHRAGSITATGVLQWPEAGAPEAPRVSFTIAAPDWEGGHLTLSGGEADALARLLATLKASPWLTGFLTSASMQIESYERGVTRLGVATKTAHTTSDTPTEAEYTAAIEQLEQVYGDEVEQLVELVSGVNADEVLHDTQATGHDAHGPVYQCVEDCKGCLRVRIADAVVRAVHGKAA